MTRTTPAAPLAGQHSEGPLRTRRALDVAAAELVAATGQSFARDKGLRVVVAVVDAWGRLLDLRRTDGVQPASDAVAVAKARTAAIFVRPTRELEDQVGGGRLGALALHGAAALTGGIPLRVDGEVVGAVGTSGETPDEDEAVSLFAAAAALAPPAVPALSRRLAEAVAAAAGDEAARRGVAPVAAVVDAGGVLVHVHRPDAAQVASVDVATDKARTAALFRRPSADFERQAAGGRPSALHLPGAVPLGGGLPLVADGHVVGAVGVSGASSAAEDSELAAVGVAAFDGAVASPPAVTHLAAADLQAAFATGGLVTTAAAYAVDAGRRTGPGEVEHHEAVTDVMHVVEGTATVLTGAQVTGWRETGPGERRGGVITDPVVTRLAPGDVLVVPAGVAHQFSEVSDPFLYLVTKVRS